jgi:steroid delta-isomerase-like uncharacterized protein
MHNDNISSLRAALDDVWNNAKADLVSRYYHDDFVGHYPEPWGVNGAEALRTEVQELSVTFPDFHEEIHELIAADDKVIARYTITGTQAADFGEQRSSGKGFSVMSVDIYRFSDGKVAEHWTGMDFLTMYRQLGWSL